MTLAEQLDQFREEVFRSITRHVEGLVAAHCVDAGRVGVLVKFQRGSQTTAVVDPNPQGLEILGELRQLAAERVAEFRRLTDLPAQEAAVVYGFEGLEYKIQIVPRIDLSDPEIPLLSDP